MRRLVGLALLATGCAGASAAPIADAPPTPTSPLSTTTTTTTTPQPLPAALRDLRMADDRGQVTEVVDGVVVASVPGLLGMDGTTLVGTKGNHVFWIDLDGRSRDVRVEGPVGHRISARVLVPLVTDTSGEWVAFGPASGHVLDGAIATGRSTTELVLVHPSGEVVSVELDGNLVPEAFSLEPADGTAPWLYVLEYLPAEAPTRYRVRLLDPNTGELSWPLSLRDKTVAVDTEMAGISRDQVVAGGQALIFTLYRGHHGETDHPYAFIHVLSMWGGVWCLDVPAELDLARQQGVVAVSPDESTLYAVSANGFVAEYRIDDVLSPQRAPAASRVVRVSGGMEERPVAVVTDEHLVIGQGRTVTWYDGRDLTHAAQAAGPSFPEAIAATSDGAIIVAADGTLGLAEPERPIDPLVVLPAGTGDVVRIASG